MNAFRYGISYLFLSLCTSVSVDLSVCAFLLSACHITALSSLQAEWRKKEEELSAASDAQWRESREEVGHYVRIGEGGKEGGKEEGKLF